MSGAEAFALVTGVMTVITFAVDTTKACKAIYDNKSIDDDLQTRATALQTAAEAVRKRFSSWRPQSVDEQKLADVARGCEEAAADLLKEIKALSRQGSTLSTWKTAAMSVWKQPMLHKMEKRLDNYKSTLQTGLLVRLCSNVDVALLQQMQDFRHLHDDFTQLLSQIAESHQKLTGVVASEHSKTRDHAFQSIQDAQASTEHEVRRALAAAATEEQRKQLLQSLKYAQMNDRRNRIDDTHDGTFHWVLQPRNREASENSDHAADSESTEEESVYEERESDWWSISSDGSGRANDNHSSDLNLDTNRDEHPQDNDSCDDLSESHPSSSESSEPWHPPPSGTSVLDSFDNFVEWLRSDQSMYWIQGKPGSGKSTLVKYIAASPLTSDALVHWHPNTQLLSHYFWKVGGGDQCTIKGFWSSLIYQLLALGGEELADHVLKENTEAQLKSDISDWSLKELETTCLTILRRKTEPICLFVDGMDEIDDKDGVEALKNAINKISLAAPAGVKFCLSSRPEHRFETWLGPLPTLKLHKLTHDDMLRFVDDRVRADQAVSNTLSEGTAAEVRRRLVEKAEGVFLWLALATDSVLRGISQDDSDREIFERIDHLPGELGQLYSEMWRRVNGESALYHKEAARFLNLVVIHRRLGLSEPLTIQGITLTTMSDYRSTLDWIVADGERAWQEIRPQYSKTERRMRIRCAGLLDFAGLPESRWVTFIHRTAYDYLMDTAEGQTILGYGSVSLMDKVADVLLAVWTSLFASRMHGVNSSRYDIASLLGKLLFHNIGEVGYEAVPGLVQLYFELEHTWGWRYPLKASDQTTSAACPLRFPLYWLLSYGRPNMAELDETRTKFCALEALRRFPNASRTATFAWIDFVSDMSYRGILVYSSHEWGNQSFRSMSLHLLESGADVTAVIPSLYLGWSPSREDGRYMRGSSILERLVVSLHVGERRTYGKYGKAAILDVIARISSAEGLSRTTLAVFDLWNKGWLSASPYYEWRPQTESPLTLRIALILRVNLMHVVQLSALDGADEDSDAVFEQLSRLYSPVLDEPVQLVGIYIGLNPTGRIETSQCYRVRALPSLSSLLALEDLVQLTSTQFPPHMTEARLYRRARACIRDGVRQGALEKMENMSELMVQEGVLTPT